jgi:ankyrin repeat protein
VLDAEPKIVADIHVGWIKALQARITELEKSQLDTAVYNNETIQKVYDPDFIMKHQSFDLDRDSLKAIHSKCTNEDVWRHMINNSKDLEPFYRLQTLHVVRSVLPSKNPTEAFHKRDLKSIEMFIKSKTYLGDVDNDGNSFLHLAVQKRDVEMIKLLITRKWPFDVSNKWHQLPLHILCDTIDNDDIVVEIANILIDYNKKYITCSDCDGLTPLHYTVLNGNVALTELLLKKGAKVDPIDKKGRTPFSLLFDPETNASEENKLNMAGLLLVNGANPNLKIVNNTKSTTPLHQACSENCIRMVQMLINAHVDMSVLDSDGRAAIYYAVENNNMEIVKSLIHFS